MLRAFKNHIAATGLLAPGQALLLAMSGGADSVVLAHLLKASGFSLALAHCNFNLRGKDSIADERFCKRLAKQLNVPVYIQQFEPQAYAKTHRVSLQMAARELRYAWFDQLLDEQKGAVLVTAHHAGDVVETILINLLRGTGIKGLKGIPEKSGRLVRPLLPFSKEEILTYARANKIRYRTDKSNLEPKYERNFLRLKVIPLLKELQPALEQVMLNNVANFKEEAAMVQEVLVQKLKPLMVQKNGWTYLDKTRLKNDPQSKSLLHAVLSPLGFNPTQLGNIEKNIRGNGLVGKVLNSRTHVLTIDRGHLVLRPKTASPAKNVVISSLKELVHTTGLRLKRINRFTKPLPNELVISSARLIFPLTLRTPRQGDKFKPFGMSGVKLLSDFLKDQKLNNFEKESCKLLVNGNGEIIWVLGYRSDERYRVAAGDADLIKLTLSE